MESENDTLLKKHHLQDDQDDSYNVQTQGEKTKKNSFTIFKRISLPFTVVIVLCSIGVVIGGTGQQIGLPLYLSSFGAYAGTGAYFVIWFCSFTFTIFFGLCAIVLMILPYFGREASISPEMKELKWHRYMFLVGMFDAMNGIMVVYSSFLSRVPGPLQSILSQSMVPFTLGLSWIILRKKYTLRQFLGAFGVLLGILVSLVPTFEQIHSDKSSLHTDQIWWPFIFLIGFIPASLMNIVQEFMQDKFRGEAKGNKRFSILYFQAVESFYQWLWMTMFFWTDLIPGFGVSGSVSAFWNNFSFEFKCFFGTSTAIEEVARCQYCGALGLLFIASYISSYIFATAMTMYASANLQSLLGSLSPVLSIIFWFAFPAVNSWAGGSPYTWSIFAYNVGAIPLVIGGSLLFRSQEQENKAPDHDEAESGVELCC